MGIFGLLLAFSFTMAQQRFELRKQLVVEEANAIGPTFIPNGWLRSGSVFRK